MLFSYDKGDFYLFLCNEKIEILIGCIKWHGAP